MPPSLLEPVRKLPTALATLLVLAGCGASETGRQFDTNDAISFGSFGVTADIDCARGKSLTVSGSNNTLTVIGACTSVSVGGADNTVRIARIDGELSVIGLNNTISYQSGDPKVSDSGTGNRITQG